MAKRKSKRRTAARKKARAKSRPKKITRKKSAPRKQSKRAAPKKSARKETPAQRKARQRDAKQKQIIRNQQRIIKDLTKGRQRFFKPDSDAPSAPDQPTFPREFSDDDDGEESREELPDADDGWYDEGFDYDDGIDDYGDYDDADIYGDEQ